MDERRAAQVLEKTLSGEEECEEHDASTMNQAAGEMPSGAMVTSPMVGGFSGSTHPQVLLCSIPNTTATSPIEDRATLRRSMRTLCRGVGSVTMRAHSTTPIMMSTSAANT